MASVTRDANPPQRRRHPAWQLAAGLAATVVVLIVLVVPVVVMLLMPPRGIPTPLPDGLSVVLLAVAGVVVGITVRTARTRPLLALTAAALVTLLALWFQAGTWWSAAWVPAPPLLPNVPPTLVLVAGVLLTTLAAALGAGSSHQEATPGADRGGSWPARTVLLGAVAAAAIVAVVEGDVWGRRLLQETFEGPWGLSRFRWLALLFVALLLAGALVGWVASAVRHAPLAPTVAAALLAAAVLLVWAVAGLDGPPRSTLYGLTLGLFAVAAVTSRRGAHRPGS